MQTTQLTFTRFVAAFFVILLHFGGSLFIIDNDFIIAQRNHLYLGVDYFYVLSGFVMMIAYGNKDYVEPIRYYINRIARVYPLHFFTLILTILISIGLSINYLSYFDFNFTAFLSHLGLVQSWIPRYSLTFNVPSWSVSTEMFFYFTFPLIFNHIFKKFSFRNIAIIFICFWVIMQLAMNYYFLSPAYPGYNSLERYFLYYNPFLHLQTFCIGLLFGKYFLDNYQKISKNYDFAILGVFFASMVLVYLMDGLFLHNGIFAINFGILIFLVAANTGKLTRLFNKKPLIYLGEISFSMYLFQNPVYIVLRKIFQVILGGTSNHPYLFFFVGLFILIFVSHLAYKYIETPMRDKIRNIKL